MIVHYSFSFYTDVRMGCFVDEGEVPSLKEFLQEATDDLDREMTLQEQASDVPIEHQVFENKYEFFLCLRS